MNPIQQAILRILIVEGAQKYSALKAPEVDPKLFNYHLSALRDRALVIKTTEGLYTLSSKGQLFVERLDGRRMQQQQQPRVATMIICQNEQGEYLLYRRAIEPFKGQVGFPWGKAHVDESINNASYRELLEWSGIETDLWAIGVVDMMIYQQQELMSHTIFHLFRGITDHMKLSSEKVFWRNVEASHDLNNKEYLMWFKDIFPLLYEKYFFTKEFIYHIE